MYLPAGAKRYTGTRNDGLELTSECSEAVKQLAAAQCYITYVCVAAVAQALQTWCVLTCRHDETEEDAQAAASW